MNVVTAVAVNSLASLLVFYLLLIVVRPVSVYYAAGLASHRYRTEENATV